DGLPVDSPGLLDQHLATCPACREQWAAVLRLQDGLRLFAPPLPPPGLAQRIAGRALAEGRARQRRRRWLRAACALAAAVLLVVLGGKDRPRPPVAALPRPAQPVAMSAPSLRESVAEAGSAVVNLTRRTADETVGQTRLLLPVVVQTAQEETPLPSLEPPV